MPGQSALPVLSVLLARKESRGFQEVSAQQVR
jgi:hypothetical protein